MFAPVTPSKRFEDAVASAGFDVYRVSILSNVTSEMSKMVRAFLVQVVRNTSFFQPAVQSFKVGVKWVTYYLWVSQRR